MTGPQIIVAGSLIANPPLQIMVCGNRKLQIHSYLSTVGLQTMSQKNCHLSTTGLAD